MLCNETGNSFKTVASCPILVLAGLLWSVDAAFADGTGSLDSFTGPLKNGLNLIMVFGFIAGCVMVMTGFSERQTR